MTQSIKAFIDKQVAGRWGPSKNEGMALCTLLVGSTGYDEAAQNFTGDCAAARNAVDARGHLPAMWKLVENMAGKYPNYHEKLVGLLEAMHHLPDLVIRGETAVKWSELPLLVEGWDQIYNRALDEYSGEHVAVIAFIARLLSARLLPQDEFLQWAERDMHDALEKGPEDASALKKNDVVVLDVNVPVAAQWIKYAGPVLWNCESDLGLPQRAGSLWQGSAGYSYSRWKFWKERARWISGLKMANEGTRVAAKGMVEEMSNIEKDDGF